MTIAVPGPIISLTRSERERAILIICSAVALCLGGFVALGTAQWLASTILVVMIFVTALAFDYVNSCSQLGHLGSHRLQSIENAALRLQLAAFRRKRRFLLPALWFCWLLLLFGFGSASLRTYSPLHLSMTRFQYPMLLPAILLISGLASSFLSPSGPTEPEMPYRARLFSRLLLITYLSVLFLVTATWGVRLGMGRECRVEREIAGVLKPTDPLYTDWHTAVALQFFWKFPATDSTHDFEGVTLSQLPSRVYVLLNRDELKAMRYNAKYVLPRFLDSVPPTWQKLRDKDNAILYWIPPFPVSN